MNNNYEIIKNQIKRFCFEKLKNNQAAVQRFEELNKQNNRMIQNAIKLELFSAAIIYSYLREYKLNGKNGITTKDLASYFNVKQQAITSKVFDVDCIVNRNAIFPEDDNKVYEFIDIDRFEVSEEYYAFLESKEAQNVKQSEKILLKLIKQDPDFFDTYTVLHEYYLKEGKGSKAFSLMEQGYERAMNLVLKNGKFPDSLPWGFVENRHIVRLMFNFAALLWLNNDKENALVIFKSILKSNPNDNIGARYAIAAILDGVNSQFELERMFVDSNGFFNWGKQEKWFNKISLKYYDDLA